eukprot:1985535-Prymnesium_polylepis.1
MCFCQAYRTRSRVVSWLARDCRLRRPRVRIPARGFFASPCDRRASSPALKRGRASGGGHS